MKTIRNVTSLTVLSAGLTLAGVWLLGSRSAAQAQQPASPEVEAPAPKIEPEILALKISAAAQMSLEEERRVQQVLARILPAQEEVERIGSAAVRRDMRQRLGRETARQLAAAVPSKAAQIRAYLKTTDDSAARQLFAGLDRGPAAPQR